MKNSGQIVIKLQKKTKKKKTLMVLKMAYVLMQIPDKILFFPPYYFWGEIWPAHFLPDCFLSYHRDVDRQRQPFINIRSEVSNKSRSVKTFKNSPEKKFWVTVFTGIEPHSWNASRTNPCVNPSLIKPLHSIPLNQSHVHYSIQ